MWPFCYLFLRLFHHSGKFALFSYNWAKPNLHAVYNCMCLLSFPFFSGIIQCSLSDFDAFSLPDLFSGEYLNLITFKHVDKSLYLQSFIWHFKWKQDCSTGEVHLLYDKLFHCVKLNCVCSWTTWCADHKLQFVLFCFLFLFLCCFFLWGGSMTALLTNTDLSRIFIKILKNTKLFHFTLFKRLFTIWKT